MSPSAGSPPSFVRDPQEEEPTDAVFVVNDRANELFAFLTDPADGAKVESCMRYPDDMMKEKERRRDSLVGLIYRLKA